MDWTTGIQRAIDYIEAHIAEPLDYDEIARQALSSGYHFQRVFGILCVATPFGGMFRGDFAIVSVALFVIDWVCLRIAASLR